MLPGNAKPAGVMDDAIINGGDREIRATAVGRIVAANGAGLGRVHAVRAEDSSIECLQETSHSQAGEYLCA